MKDANEMTLELVREVEELKTELAIREFQLKDLKLILTSSINQLGGKLLVSDKFVLDYRDSKIEIISYLDDMTMSTVYKVKIN